MKKLFLILLCLPMIFSCGDKKADKDKTKKLEDRIAELENKIENKDEGSLDKEVTKEILEDGYAENNRINYCDILFSDSSIKQRNIYKVFINRENRLMVEYEIMDISQLRKATKRFLSNNGKNPLSSDSPQKAIISLKRHKETAYNTYIRVQNELAAAYNELRNKAALNKFGERYANLNKTQKKEIRKMYPQKISEAEPKNIGGDS